MAASSDDKAPPSLSSSGRARDPLIGTVINGKFHIERAIARGGMGRIYFGRQAPLDRPVALKIVKADSINEEESQFLKRFLLEASILAKLQHPNVVTLFDYGRIEGAKVEMYFIAMEFLDGETLSERLRGGALAAFETLILFRQIARGLREAHSRGVVHRDLKPSNIIIIAEAGSESEGGANEIVKLVDFGIGKVDAADETGEDLTRDGVLVGTPKYMAPEQFDGQSSPASDVYGLGTIMYQCLTGALPFSGSTLPELMVAKLQHDVKPMREVNPICDATTSFEQLVREMLMRVPEQRPTLDEVFGKLALCEDEIFGGSGPRMGGTGSRRDFGFPNSSRSISFARAGTAESLEDSLPRPPRALGIVTQRLTPRVMMTSPSADPNLAMIPEGPTRITGVTRDVPVPPPPPMSSSMNPASLSSGHLDTTAGRNQPAKKNVAVAALAVAIGFGLVSMGGVIAWVALSRPPPSAGPSPFTATPPPPMPTTDPVSTTSPSFVLHLESNPPGAIVTENGMVLGPTPLDVSMQRESVAKGPRTFQLKKDGHLPTTVTQGPSEMPSVAQVVSLAPDAPRAVKSASPSTTKPPSVAKPTPPTTKDPAGDDIRLKR